MGRSRTPSTATADTGVLSEGDCSTSNKFNPRADSIDIDFSSVTESGRAIAHLVNGMDGANDGLDFTIEHIIANQMHADGSVAESANTSESNIKSKNKPTIVPAVTATVSNPLSIPKASKATANGIPQARPPPQHSHNTRLRSKSNRPRSTRAESHDSSGSDFLSGIMNPSAAVNVESQLSHTPPTAFGTSYENSHFGKRQRAGVSLATGSVYFHGLCFKEDCFPRDVPQYFPCLRHCLCFYFFYLIFFHCCFFLPTTRVFRVA